VLFPECHSRCALYILMALRAPGARRGARGAPPARSSRLVSGTSTSKGGSPYWGCGLGVLLPGASRSRSRSRLQSSLSSRTTNFAAQKKNERGCRLVVTCRRISWRIAAPSRCQALQTRTTSATHSYCDGYPKKIRRLMPK
jgi:hypothetical protein